MISNMNEKTKILTAQEVVEQGFNVGWQFPCVERGDGRFVDISVEEGEDFYWLQCKGSDKTSYTDVCRTPTKQSHIGCCLRSLQNVPRMKPSALAFFKS